MEPTTIGTIAEDSALSKKIKSGLPLYHNVHSKPISDASVECPVTNAI